MSHSSPQLSATAAEASRRGARIALLLADKIPEQQCSFLEAALRDVPAAQRRTRIAPSVTGHLHRGHLLHLAYVWGLAVRTNSRIVVRLEDHDRQRWRSEFAASIVDDLTWLGILADPRTELPIQCQSDRPERYVAALRRLADVGAIYGCTCTRRDLLLGQPAPGGGDERRYPGTCRARRIPWDQPGVTVRMVVPDETLDFVDVVHGPIRQIPAEQCGDVALCDRHGQYTFQFSVVVDDILDGITFIVRGEDILASTGRQLLLRRSLCDAGLTSEVPCATQGANEPIFFHHALVVDRTSGAKISKTHGAVGLREARSNEADPEAMITEVVLSSP